MSDLIDRKPVITEADKAEDFELNFTLHHPITEEEWDAITDVDFDHTEEIFFHTKHGKEVTFVKQKKGKWIKDEEKSADHVEPIFICSSCHNYEAWGLTECTRYCPYCGSFNGGEDEQRT